MSAYADLLSTLRSHPKRWAVTGVAGFIGSHLVETLLSLGQQVVGLDNFATGHAHNLEDVHACVGDEAWGRFTFIDGNICEPADCAAVCDGADYLLHQAALGSVPRSIQDPAASVAANVMGFINMLVAARDAEIGRIVFASSSSVYGDHPELPKVEEKTGNLLSPYAATKAADELFASVFGRVYGMQIIGLRYFNVFGPRQDPAGAYAAVIPRWIATILAGDECTIFGDGETSRDFSYIANVVQANLLAATSSNEQAAGEMFNVAIGSRVTLNEIYSMIYQGIAARIDDPSRLRAGPKPLYQDFRAGDIRHSNADISKVERLLAYEHTHSVEEGLAETLEWYLSR